jgi:hypothetical protein
MTAASPFDGLPGGWLTPRRTLLLVGNLPVMSALWISQYADREARENGPVCLVRESGDCVQIELFRAGSRLPTIRPQATYEEALRAIAPIVSQWLVVARQSEPVEISHGTDDIVVLTGSDQAAIVAAYRLVKAAHDAIERLGGARPAVSVAVLGADAAETAHVAARIGEAASSSLSISIPVRGGLQRVAPAESSFRGTFEGSAPCLAHICEVIATAAAHAPRRTLVSASVASAVSASASYSASSASTASEPLRFTPRVERKGPGARPAADSIPFRSDLPPRGGRGLEPVRTPPSIAPTQHAAREILADASSTLREVSASNHASTNASPRTPYVASAVNGPSAAPPIARIVEGGLPESLVPFVAGLSRIDHFAPRCERIEFAVEANGQLHLVCRVDDLRMLARARAWMSENSGLFRKAYPEIASVDDPSIDIFVQEVREFEPIDGATVRVLRQLEFSGRRCYDVQTISA